MGTCDKSFVFSSEAVRDDDVAGFGGYHDLYPVASDVAMTGDHFYAEAHAHQLSRMIVLNRKLSGVTHVRHTHHARRDGFDHVVLQLVVSGNWISGVPGEERVVQPGEVIFQDMTRAQRNVAGAAEIITVNLPREDIEAVTPIRREMHGVVLPMSASVLLGEFMLMLNRRGADVPTTMADSAGRAMAELAAGAFSHLGAGQSSTSREAHFIALRRERAELFIEKSLADTALDADMVAHRLGVSRTVLYQLFKSSGGVARYILTRRLERLRNALRKRTETRSVSQLAFLCGFASESHCSRAFRIAYGMPPGQYRNEPAGENLTHGDYIRAAHSDLHTWHTALR